MSPHEELKKLQAANRGLKRKMRERDRMYERATAIQHADAEDIRKHELARCIRIAEAFLHILTPEEERGVGDESSAKGAYSNATVRRIVAAMRAKP